MRLDGYQLRAQLGAGPDGVSYRALAEDGDTEVEVRDSERCPPGCQPLETTRSAAPHGGPI